MTSFDSIKIPDLKQFLKDFQLKLNPHFNAVIDEAKNWIQELKIDLNFKENKRGIEKSDHGSDMLMVRHSWIQTSPEGLLVAMEFCRCVFLLDDLFEKNCIKGQNILAITKNLVQDLNHVDGKSKFGKKFKEFVTEFCLKKI